VIEARVHDFERNGDVTPTTIALIFFTLGEEEDLGETEDAFL